MKAYVINLDNRPDRMETFKENIFPFDVERVSAIKMDNGALGCTLTHFEIFKKNTEYPFVIFEDDCQFIEPWSLVEKAMSQLPDNWDALWLGATLDAPLKRYSENLFRLRRAYCTHAIMYNSPKIIEYILNNFLPFDGRKIIDVFYHKDVQENFNCFITYPMTTIQRNSMSDVMKREQDDSDQIWRKKCYYKYTNEIPRR